MNWISLAFPRRLSQGAARFFGAFSERSVARGALAAIALSAAGIAIAAGVGGYQSAGGEGASANVRPPARLSEAALPSAPASGGLAVLSCLDELAGDIVLAACEKAVFASAESTAAAVSYVAAQITRLTSLPDLGSEHMTPDLKGLRRSIERDRYGLVAHVLEARERCTPTECVVFRSLANNHQIISNMNDHVYDGLVSRYAPSWTAPSASPAMRALAAYPPSAPTGKPTNAEFPSAASTPAVSIMSPEPGTGRAAVAGATPAGGTVASPPASAGAPASLNPPMAAARKPPPKPSHPPPAAPTQISPVPSASAAAQ